MQLQLNESKILIDGERDSIINKCVYINKEIFNPVGNKLLAIIDTLNEIKKFS